MVEDKNKENHGRENQEKKELKEINEKDLKSIKDIIPEQELDEIKKKLQQLKDKLDKFKDKVVDKFSDYIIGISLLPPEKKESKDIEVLVLVDDSDSKTMSKFELRDKLVLIIEKFASEIDKLIKPQVMLLSELRESCFDGRFEILGLISYGASVYDPKDLLAALKVSEIHRSMVIKKFEKYVVSYVAVGSLFRGDARSNDIDVAVVIDDTDVKKMSRAELRDKLGAIIRSMGYEAGAIANVKKSFHIQVYILTDFWESVKEASPVIFTFLRDGVPLYDRGVFMPWKLLLEMGRIKPSPEAIDLHMDLGDRLIERAKNKLVGILAEDVYYAILNPSQAALMLYGVPPPTPRETIKLLNEIFVKKEKLLESKYVAILEKIFKYFKDIEHFKIKYVTGKEIDELMEDANEYLKRIKRLFTAIEKKTEKDRIVEFHDSCMKLVGDVLDLEEIKDNDAVKGFKKLVDSGKFAKNYLDNLKGIVKLKNEHGKMSKQEIEKIRRESSSFIRALIDYTQRKRGLELERAKIRIKYGDKFGEILLLDDVAFIIDDIDSEKKTISKAKILPNGGLGEIINSNVNELEDAIAKSQIPKKVFIKEKIFEDLRKLYGKDVEVLVNY